MKILVYSYFPPLRDHVLGGAQRFLDGLLNALQRRLVEVAVLCPPSPARALLPDGPGRRVVADLAAVDADPTPAEAHQDLRLLSEYCTWADVVLTIDRSFPLEVDIPVVLGLNNFSYGPETRSVYSLTWDAIVVPSDYLRRHLSRHFGEASWHGSRRSVHVIPCGVAPAALADPCSRELRDALRLSNSGRYLAFPHRPDPDKGFETAVRAVQELRRTGHDFTLLVPSPQPSEVWPHQRRYLQQRQDIVAEHSAEGSVRFHRWIRASEMAAYLQSVEWSLCLSELPEGFGLAVLEGLVAGVPVVATPAGAVHELVPDHHGVEFVEFSDADAVARIVAGGVSRERVENGRAYAIRTYDWNAIAETWVDVFGSVGTSMTHHGSTG